MIIGDGIMLGAGGESASIFVTGLSETDTVTATKGSKTLTGKWTQKPNPAYVVPDGYTQLEYIELSGSQAIFLGDNLPSRAKVSAKVMVYKTSGSYCIFSYLRNSINSRGAYISTYDGKWYMDINSTEYYSVSYSANTLYEVSCDARTDTAKFYVDGVETYSTTPRENINTRITLGALGRDLTPIDYFNGRIYQAEYEDYSGTIVKTLIPAKRNSDDVIGMYDIVNEVFYANAGTGIFTAGAEIPQTIDGFLIDKIKDYGTWTVMATDGVQTATQNILVDSVVQYDISLSYVDERLQIWLNGSGYTDESLVGNTITNYGTSLVTSGDFPYYLFDGSSHYIQFSSQTINPNDFAISLWGYFDGNYSFERLFDFGEGAAKDLWCGHLNINNVIVFEYRANGTAYTSSKVSFSSGAWHHIALRGNNGTTTMYVDGANVASMSNPSIDTLSLINCYLGKSNWDEDDYLHGRIADFRLYNTAITEAEIIELYQNGAYVPN